MLTDLNGFVRNYVSEEAKRPRMSPKAIKAWGTFAVLVLGAVQTLLTSIRMNEAAAQGRQQQAEVARQNVLDERLLSTQRAIEDASKAAAQRAAEDVRRALREEQVAADAAANMRVAPARRKK